MINPPPINPPHREYLIGGLFIIVLVILGGVYIYNRLPPFSDLNGKVFLTLSPKDKNQTRLYTYDLKTKKLERIKPNILAMTISISPDGKYSAFIMFPRKVDGTLSTTTIQLHVRDRKSGEIEQITKSKTSLKRLPDWSPDGINIAFMAQDSSKKKFFVPNDWDVYITDLSGNERFVTEGGYPKWSPDGKKLLLFKNDGLYLYNLASSGQGALKKLWNGKVYLNMKLAINQSRDTIAWASIDTNETLIFKVDFENENVQGLKRINNRGFWSVFSPDNKYLIVQEVDWGATLSRPRLTAYTLAGNEKKEILNLDNYNQGKMFLTDWR